MATEQSLIQIESDSDHILIQSKMIPWLHPVLRHKLNKALLWSILNILLIALEFLHIVKPTYPYLFPVLLTLGMGFQWFALHQFRQHIFVLELDPKHLSLWEGAFGAPQTEPTLIPLSEIQSIAIAQQMTGRNKSQSALCLTHQQNESMPLFVGAGLNSADLETMQAVIQGFKDVRTHG